MQAGKGGLNFQEAQRIGLIRVGGFPLDHKIIDCPLLKNSDWIRE